MIGFKFDAQAEKMLANCVGGTPESSEDSETDLKKKKKKKFQPQPGSAPRVSYGFFNETNKPLVLYPREFQTNSIFHISKEYSTTGNRSRNLMHHISDITDVKVRISM